MKKVNTYKPFASVLYTTCLLTFLLTVCSCADNEKGNRFESESERTAIIKDTIEGFSFDDEKHYLIDSSTSVNFRFLSYYGDKEKEVLSFLNDKNHTIYFYDFNKKELIRKIPLSKEGPNGVGQVLNGFYVHTEDSIFVVSRYKIFLVNTKGEVYKSYNFFKPVDRLTALPQITTNSPILITQGKAYINCYPDVNALHLNNGKPQSLIGLDLKSGEHEFLLSYPREYIENIYGPNYYNKYNLVKDGKMMVSFSASGDIISFDSKKRSSKKIYAGSNHFDDVPAMRPVMSDHESYTKFYITSPSYEQLYYDKYNDLYYRVVALPRSIEDYNGGKRWKNKAVVVLNAKFEKLGEALVNDDTLAFSQCISTPKGVFVLYFKDENHLSLKKITPLYKSNL